MYALSNYGDSGTINQLENWGTVGETTTLAEVRRGGNWGWLWQATQDKTHTETYPFGSPLDVYIQRTHTCTIVLPASYPAPHPRLLSRNISDFLPITERTTGSRTQPLRLGVYTYYTQKFITKLKGATALVPRSVKG